MKKLIITLFFFFIALASFAQYSVLDSLVLYYPFAGNANDWSGNNFHGNINGPNLAMDRSGNLNHAYYFDGTDDFIDLPNNNKLHPDFPFTIAAWINPLYDPTNSLFNIIGTEFTTNNVYVGAWLNLCNMFLQASTTNGGLIGSSSFNLKKSIQQLSYNNWYHVVGVYDSVTSKKIYINCVEDAGIYNGSATTYVKNTSLNGSIGRYYAGGPNTIYAYGYIDEVAIWNRALEEDDILMLCEIDMWEIISMGIDENSNNPVTIMPNPAVDKVEVVFNNPNNEKYTLCIYI